MEYEKAFSERLAKLRINAGMSARDLSLSMGQSSGYINKIERAQNMPSMTGFFYMCEILKITPKDFFDDAVQDPYRVNALTEKLKLEGAVPYMVMVCENISNVRVTQVKLQKNRAT